MARIMALDVGRKRTGLAVTDGEQIIVSALDTVATGNLLPYLRSYLAHEAVELFVVGEPRTLRNEPSESMPYVKQVCNMLAKHFPDIPVRLHDERFTSSLAQQVILHAGVPKLKRQNKALTDRVSAIIILQSFLEARQLQKR